MAFNPSQQMTVAPAQRPMPSHPPHPAVAWSHVGSSPAMGYAAFAYSPSSISAPSPQYPAQYPAQQPQAMASPYGQPTRRPLPTPGMGPPIVGAAASAVPAAGPATNATAAVSGSRLPLAAPATAASTQFRSPLPTPEPTPAPVSPPPRTGPAGPQPLSPQTPSGSSPNRRPLPNPANRPPMPSAMPSAPERAASPSGIVAAADSRSTSPTKFVPYWKRTLPPLNTLNALDSPATSNESSNSSHESPSGPTPSFGPRPRGKSVSNGRPLPASPTMPPDVSQLNFSGRTGQPSPEPLLPKISAISVPRGWADVGPLISPPRMPANLRTASPADEKPKPPGQSSQPQPPASAALPQRSGSPQYGIRQLPARSRSIVDETRQARRAPLPLPEPIATSVAAAAGTTMNGARPSRSATLPRPQEAPVTTHGSSHLQHRSSQSVTLRLATNGPPSAPVSRAAPASTPTSPADWPSGLPTLPRAPAPKPAAAYASPLLTRSPSADPLDDSPPASIRLRTSRSPSPVSPIRFAERSRSSSPVSPIRFAQHSPDIPPYRTNPYAIVPPRGGYSGSYSNPASPTRREAPLPPPPPRRDEPPSPQPPRATILERGRTMGPAEHRNIFRPPLQHAHSTIQPNRRASPTRKRSNDEALPQIKVPTINIPGGGSAGGHGGGGSGPAVPVINVPQINVGGGNAGGGPPSLPSINIPGSGPQISVNGKSANGSVFANGAVAAGGSPFTNRLACGGCGRPIVGRIVSAMGARWHPECFRCCECNEHLEYVSSYEHEGRPYCHLDYHEKFAPRCFHCKTAIVDERFITLDDAELGKRTYHEQHFFCAECGDPFLTPSIPGLGSSGGGERTFTGDGDFADGEGDVGFTVYGGHPYCEPCHVRLRSPKCKRCKTSIRDGQEAIEAMGGKWHWECFKCTGCEKPFDNPSFFLRSEKPFCEGCFSIIIKSEM